MAAQAQYPIPNQAFMEDFWSRGRDTKYYVSPPRILIAGALADDTNHHKINTTNVGGGAPNLLSLYNSGSYEGIQAMNGRVFSSDPESELTCNSRKRPREDDASLIFAQQQQRRHHHNQQQQLQHMNSMASSPDFQHKNAASSLMPQAAPLMVSSGLQLSYDDTRLQNQSSTSTSGRSSSVVMPLPPCGDEISSQLHQQSEDLDRLIRLQTEKMLVAVEEKNRRQSRALISMVEEGMMRKLKEKETEIENGRSRNAEPEERIRQLSADKQLWQTMAKNNEAVVNRLKNNLHQVVAQCREQSREGFGDSEADDAASCCNEESVDMHAKTLKENKQFKMQRSCKVCRRNEVCILLLPCRHLCLCKECESRINTCPICSSVKNASVQIYMA